MLNFNLKIISCGFAAFFLFALAVSAQAETVQMDWVNQFGGIASSFEFAQAIDANGNVYVVGETAGTLAGQANLGGTDAFLRKYDKYGVVIWTRQFGTSAYDSGLAVAVDASGVYIVGETLGTFSGQISAGGRDAFLLKYDLSGNLLWTNQFGTEFSERGLVVVLDSTGVYAGGQTEGILPGQTNAGSQDVFVRKYTLAGALVWTKQYGTSGQESALGAAVDSSGIYVVGFTLGAFSGETNVGASDIFVQKYDLNGNLVWTRQFGTTGNDFGYRIGVDSTGVYAVGQVEETLPWLETSGGYDAFVRKYDLNGNLLWADQFGTSGYDGAYALDVDSSGVYVGGGVEGALAGQTYSGNGDSFVRKYNSSGTIVWTKQFGTSGYEDVWALAINSYSVFSVGGTDGVFAGQTSAGDFDTFLAEMIMDGDDDNIFDEIDKSVGTYSNLFTDEKPTNGSIQSRGNQILTVKDAVSVVDGVYVAADSSGGATAAEIKYCGNNRLFLSPGNSAIITCGSATLSVLTGVVEAEFVDDYGNVVANVSLSEGNTLTFEPTTATFTVPETNPDPVVLLVDGAEYSVAPGEIFIPIVIDIKPGDDVNAVNLRAKGVIPVAVLTTASFDASKIDVATLTLSGASVNLRGKSGNIAVFEDVDNDGDLDLSVSFGINELSLIEGQSVAVLSGRTFDGARIEGSSHIRVVP